MKLENIFENWNEDSKINRSDLVNESLKISELHNKYHRIFTQERLLLRQLESDSKVLRLDKYEFYTQGPTKDTIERGWKLPPIGKILKTDSSQYIEADKDIIALNLKIGIQQEKIELLDSILKSLASRSFNIRNSIEAMKFENGVM